MLVLLTHSRLADSMNDVDHNIFAYPYKGFGASTSRLCEGAPKTMGDVKSKKNKLSRSMTLVKKWFDINTIRQESRADVDAGGDTWKWRSKFLERETCIKNKRRPDKLSKKDVNLPHEGKCHLHSPRVKDVQDYKIFVATWNVGGKSPPRNLNLLDWLNSSSPADIYVLGFQEIVPLNAGNILGAEDNGPANKWLWLIRKTLNSPDTCGSDSYHTPSPVHPILEMYADFEMSTTRQRNSSFQPRRSFHSSNYTSVDADNLASEIVMDHRFSFCDRFSFESRSSDFDSNFGCEGSSDDDNIIVEDLSPAGNFSSHGYCLVASKQMVGIFLTIWVRSDIREHVKNLKISCVGRGLMGYLRNKGSISISMSLHETRFCFVCSHLTSGQKEGDELRRNSDVMEILKKTRFPWVQSDVRQKPPQTVLDHDRIIWLGDLNYRIALSYQSVKALVEMRNWRALLEKDQLQIEQRCGRVFEGWSEGRIYFPPTYKYSNNSDQYAGDALNPKAKRRTPAWCDRILWYGRGLTQLSYVRGESKFSDHRPVCSIFTAEVEVINQSQFNKNIGSSSSRVEVEELLPHSVDC